MAGQACGNLIDRVWSDLRNPDRDPQGFHNPGRTLLNRSKPPAIAWSSEGAFGIFST
jgi:hypothetical protein